jgi:exonuclease III
MEITVQITVKSMRIATFKVNGINARLPNLLRWRGWEKASDHAPTWIELTTDGEREPSGRAQR